MQNWERIAQETNVRSKARSGVRACVDYTIINVQESVVGIRGSAHLGFLFYTEGRSLLIILLSISPRRFVRRRELPLVNAAIDRR